MNQRQQNIQQCIALDQMGLLKDIERWFQLLQDQNSSSAIFHHIKEFKTFANLLLNGDVSTPSLESKFLSKFPEESDDKKFSFDSVVLGVLLSQWSQLRVIAEQRSNGQPYQIKAQDLDYIAATFYYRLRNILPTTILSFVSEAPPLVYIGRVAEVTLIGHDSPALLSVPYGVMETPLDDTNLAFQTIPHEVAHAVLNQIPNFFEEMDWVLIKALSKSDRSPLARSFYTVIREWLNEILADMVGTALGGLSFAQSALMIMSPVDQDALTTDQGHPLSIIRPYIHLNILDKLGLTSSSDLATLNNQIQAVYMGYGSKPFEKLPDLSIASIDDLKEELLVTIDTILATTFETLGNIQFQILLSQCARKSSVVVPVLPNWSNAAKKTDFVLGFAGETSPVHSNPTIFAYKICCDLGWRLCC
jgi:hypothetical protein